MRCCGKMLMSVSSLMQSSTRKILKLKSLNEQKFKGQSRKRPVSKKSRQSSEKKIASDVASLIFTNVHAVSTGRISSYGSNSFSTYLRQNRCRNLIKFYRLQSNICRLSLSFGRLECTLI